MIWSEAETVMLAFGAAANAGYHQVPLILHYGELYNYFIIYHNVMLDSKEIQRVNPKGNQHFGQLMWRADSLEKTLMLEKIRGRGSRRQR